VDPTKRQARVAGVLYFLIGVTAPIGLMYVPGKLIVADDPAATADRIRASESLLRIGIASELFHQVICVFLVLALYRLFKAVNEAHARQLVILGSLVSVPIMFLNVLNEFAALMLVRGASFLSAFDQPQRDALAFLFLRLHDEGISVVSIFWGLWLFPFGMLVIRSGFFPRVLGVLMIIAGVAYLASAFTSLLLPHYAHPVGQYAMILELGEIPIMLWLLIWGARVPPTAAPRPSASGVERAEVT
jgi:hypothetical protein